ncbi:Uncharacterised protein [Salmonella enterica subsp. enterica serovar Sanjuan]|uniref:Uncharacterized protein n=1 Tax=Salmonella enterica subsp. enterica serovar Sanjuan TaxID=1160765 RepID=A0A447NFQ1_SALET|nr:Uncharacterised protein [Salmonella enterica subsp. enterica serovar Sanjuan]
MPPGQRLEFCFIKACHLFESHFPAQRRHRVHHDQAAYAFFEFAHIGLLFFSDRAAKRQVHQLLRFFTQFLAVYFAQTDNFCFQRLFFFFQLRVFIGGFNQRETCLLVANSVKTIAQAFNFFFSTSFMG